MVKPRRRIKIVKKDCSFCKEDKHIFYTDLDILRRFITERGKLVPRSRTGVCAKHQRQITFAVKHARHLALLPFIIRPF